MAKKYQVDSLDDVPEADRALYVEKDGKFVLDVEGLEDVSGLKSALQREREASRKARDELKGLGERYKDLDPEKAREALRQLEELEEQGLRDAGKIDELVAKRLKGAETEWNRQRDGLTRERDAVTAQVQTLQSRLEELLIDGALREAAAESHVRPEHYVDIRNRLRHIWRLGPEGQPVPMNGEEIIYGRGAQPITMKEPIEGILKDVPGFVLPSSGGGANGGSTIVNGRGLTLSREAARDPQQYRAAKAQADKQGVPLTIADA